MNSHIFPPYIDNYNIDMNRTLLGAKGPQKGPQPSAEARRKDDVASELLDYRSSLARKSRIYEGKYGEEGQKFTHGGKRR